MTLPMVTVGEVLRDIVSGKSVRTLERPATGNELGILRVSAVTWGEFRPHENKAMPSDYLPGNCPRPMDGDILISRANTRELVGAPVIVEGDHPNLLLSDKLLKLIPDDSLVDRRYLVRALRSPIASNHFQQSAGGSSGSMTNITQNDIRSAPIPLPPLVEQRRIAAMLDKADTLRAKRREALALLDSLAQSIFVDMFGDPLTNPKGWQLSRLAPYLKSVTNGLTRRGDAVHVGSDIVLRLRDVRTGAIDFSEPNRITLNEKERAKYLVSPGELLFVRVNGNPDYVGRCAQFNGYSEAVYFNDHVMRVRLGPDLAAGYLEFFLNRPEGKREVAKYRKTSAGQHTINQDGLGAIVLPLPPLALQRQFVDRLESIQKTRKAHLTALSTLDALFSSVQFQAFAGTLSGNIQE